MEELAKWTMGAVLVAAGAISMGYGGGMMWRTWQAVGIRADANFTETKRINDFVDAAEKRTEHLGQ